MKILLFGTAVTLALVSSFPALAGGVLRDAKAAHLVHSGAHPNNARVPRATHHFDVHVQGSDLLQLSVDVPEGIQVSDRIVVTDQSDKKIDATVSVNGRRVTIAFAQPVPTGTTLSVSMKGVRTRFSSSKRIWLYPIYSRSVGIKADVPIGMARIQTYK